MRQQVLQLKTTPSNWDLEEIPEDENEDVVIVLSKPDNQGRQMFWVRWYDKDAFVGPWMAQIFFNVVDEFKDRALENGRNVKIINKM